MAVSESALSGLFVAFRAAGNREVLGLDIGDSEDEILWRGFLRSLKQRGLGGLRLLISDQHAGLVAVIRRCFQGASDQRCRVHLARNPLAVVPKAHQDMVAALFRTSFGGIDPACANVQWHLVAAMLAERWPEAAELTRAACAELLAFTAFPTEHWRKIWSTNPLEGLIKEIKRRSRAIGVFPDEAAAVRLVGAVLIELHNNWIASERRDLFELHGQALPRVRRLPRDHRRTRHRRLTDAEDHHRSPPLDGTLPTSVAWQRFRISPAA